MSGKSTPSSIESQHFIDRVIDLPVPEVMITPKGDEAFVYEIGEKRVAFGLGEEDSIEEVEIHPRSPVGHEDILGEGNETLAAYNYAMALAGAHSTAPRNEYGMVILEHLATEVDALILDAEAGQEEAKDKLSSLVEEGRSSAATQKQEGIEGRKEHSEEYAEPTLIGVKSFLRELLAKSYFDDKYRTMSGLEESESRIDSLASLQEVVDEFGEEILNSIVLVHATKFEPVLANGAVELRPTSDYGMETEEGEAIDYPRNSVHFTLNHMVTSHIFGNWEGAPYLVVAPLVEALAQDPTSLENINEIDTYFCPPPTRPLVLPGAKVFKGQEGQPVTDQLEEHLKTLGLPKFEGGMHYGDSRAQAVTDLLSYMLKVRKGLHENSTERLVERTLTNAVAEKQPLTDEETESLISYFSSLNPHEAARAVRWGLLGGVRKPKYSFEDDTFMG